VEINFKEAPQSSVKTMPEITTTARPAAIEVAAIASGDTSAEAGAARVKAAAAALKLEHSGDTDETIETTADASETTTTAKPEAAAKALDMDAIRAAYKAGDVKKLAELMGEKENAKVTNSDWAKLRIERRDARRYVETARAELDGERSKIAAEREQLLQSSATINKAVGALERGDLISYLELSTGRPIQELVNEIADDLTDPNKREIRHLRNETERQKREREERDRKLESERRQSDDSAAKQRYVATLKQELDALPFAKRFADEYGQSFVELVFTEQQKAFDGERTITAEQAAKRVLKAQRAMYERAKQHFEALTEDFSEAEPGGKKPAKQGHQGARLSPRKPATQSQGGPGPAREMTAQERNAMFARQLRAELAS